MTTLEYTNLKRAVLVRVKRGPNDDDSEKVSLYWVPPMSHYIGGAFPAGGKSLEDKNGGSYPAVFLKDYWFPIEFLEVVGNPKDVKALIQAYKKSINNGSLA